MTYLQKFTLSIVTRLGGMEMAAEFFALHPDVERSVPRLAGLQRGAGVSPWKASAHFYRTVVQHYIDSDRKAEATA